ncbi:MAG: nuclear transport factor 2 family protein [Novosphingobium sp.]|nr:nuclear transport factor 2 family protein [Novosphingobium sp.]
MSELEAKAAIRDVLGGYSGAAGRLDIEAFLSFFTEDAEIHGIPEMMGLPGPFKGHDAIRGFFSKSFENLRWLVQMNNITDVNLAPDGKSATTSTGLVEMAQAEGADQIVLIARYDDELTLTDAGWKFTKRALTPFRFSQVP